MIHFDPSSYHKDTIYRMYPTLKSYYSHTQYQMISDKEIQQSLVFDGVPPYLLASVKRRLDSSDFTYEMVLN